MTSMRRRAAFKFASDTETDYEDNHVLDEQEQEDLITKLRDESLATSRRFLLVLQVIVGLSCLLHLIFLVTQSNPLSIFSQSVEPDPSIPLSVLFTLLAIAIHLNLALILCPDRESITFIPSFSYPILFGLSVVAPCLCILLGRELVTVTWWSAATGVVWLAHTVQRWIDMESESISELEGMKYVAPGA